MQQRDDFKSNNLSLALAKHYEKAGQPVPSREKLADAADSLLSYFGLLIEADKKVMEIHDKQSNRNSNRPNKA